MIGEHDADDLCKLECSYRYLPSPRSSHSTSTVDASYAPYNGSTPCAALNTCPGSYAVFTCRSRA